MRLQFSSDQMTEGEVDFLVRDLTMALSDTGAIKAELETRALAPGERGVATVLGAVALELLKTSGVTKMIEILGSYLTQEQSLEGELTLPDGTTIKLNGTNIRSEEFVQTLSGLLAQVKGS